MPVAAPPHTSLNPRRSFSVTVRYGGVALLLALAAANVSAQVSGTASLVSNYRFRGITLSENNPAAQLGVVYDDAQGWYAGAFASTVEFATSSGVELQAVPFLGYTWRNDAGVSWEAGTDYSAFSGSAQDHNYPELYVGMAAEHVSARLYYSSRYFGQNTATLYGEINASEPLIDRVRLIAHIGVLQSTHGKLYYGGPDQLIDGRVGVGIEWEAFDVQLSWVGINAATAMYGVTGVRSRNGLVLTLSRPF